MWSSVYVYTARIIISNWHYVYKTPNANEIIMPKYNCLLAWSLNSKRVKYLNDPAFVFVVRIGDHISVFEFDSLHLLRNVLTRIHNFEDGEDSSMTVRSFF